jgi:ribosome assembly protein 1
MSTFQKDLEEAQSDFEKREQELLFSPEKGNVVFASGTDCWGFRISDFVPLVKDLTKCQDETELLRGLWEIHLGWNGSQVVPTSLPSNSMFVNYVLKNIWSVCKFNYLCF